jgi:uncharacterized protein YgiM (DUF1202 family)
VETKSLLTGEDVLPRPRPEHRKDLHVSGLNKRTRKALAGLIVASALATGTAVLSPQALANYGTVSATTALNVRAQPNTTSKVLGVLTSGEQVERRGDPRGEWTPIKYRGQDAWVFSAYVSLGNTNAAAGGTAKATANVNVRTNASTLSAVIGTLSNGETVSVTGAAKGGWVPVNYKGRSGYVYGAYLSLGATSSAPAVANSTSTATGTAKATTHVNVRSGPGTNYSVISTLATGASVQTRGSSQNGWTPVIFNGRDAWVSSQYLSTSSSASSSSSSGTARTTTAVNLRTAAGTSNSIITVVPTGATVQTRGSSQNGWTPVTYNGRQGWMASQYLTTGDANRTSSTTTTAYTTTGVNLRTGPGINYGIVRVLNRNTKVQLTGVTQNGFSQVNDSGTLRWISTTYLSNSPVSGSSSSSSVQGPTSPGSSGGTTLNTGGSSGLDSLRPSAKQVVYAVRQNFPQITTMYGVRQDPLPDHPSGRAVDIMMPRGANDQALGDQIATYLQSNANSLNIEYLIWRQRIWINGQAGWTWMADRGGVTANHYDHIHVTVRS